MLAPARIPATRRTASSSSMEQPPSPSPFLLPFLLLATACCLLGSAAAQSSGSALPFPHLETQGKGEIEAPPDMAVISVEMEASARAASAAKVAVDAAVAGFLTTVQEKHGVAREDITSTNLRLREKYDYNTSPSKLVGYRATRSVTATVRALDTLNAVLDSALLEGGGDVDGGAAPLAVLPPGKINRGGIPTKLTSTVNNVPADENVLYRIQSIDLKASNESMYTEQARLLAISDAQSKAKSIASALNYMLNGVYQVRYQSRAPPATYRYDLAYSSSKGVGSEDIENTYQDKTIKFRDEIDVVFKLISRRTQA